MSNINITPSSPSPASPITPDSQAAGAQLSTSAQDSISPFTSASSLLSPSLVSSLTSSGGLSLEAYYLTISTASTAFSSQLAATQQSQQELRGRFMQNTVAEAELIASLVQERNQAIANAQANAQQAASTIEQQLQNEGQATQGQQKQIDQINGGNAQEKQQYQTLVNAYNNYQSQLTSLGVTVNADGTVNVPKGQQTAYNNATQTYQTAVDNFNTYWQGRLTQINQYNTATSTYNQAISTSNNAINTLVNQYQLTGLSNLPSQSPSRDLTGLPNKMPSPPVGLPAGASTLATSGPPTIPSLSAPPTVDSQKISQSAYNAIYTLVVAPLDAQIAACGQYMQFLQSQIAFDQQHPWIQDPDTSVKSLAQKIMPDSYVKPAGPNVKGATATSMVGVDQATLSVMLGKEILRQILNKSNLPSTGDKQNKVNQLSDHLQLLSVGLLGNHSMEAISPSVSQISKSINSLPSDSPVFSLLYAISFANRVQEDAQQGTTGTAVQQFIAKNPDLAALSQEDQQKIAAGINVSHLLVASKLLESSLGLPGLSAHLLQPLVPNASNLIPEAIKESNVNMTNLQTRLQSQFQAKGYGSNESKFLAETGVQLTQRGTLSPSVPSVPTPQAVDQQLLTNSVKAALVLQQMPLDQADSVAGAAVSTTLAQTPYPSTKQFRSSLESQLANQGVTTSSEVAKQAVLLSPSVNLSQDNLQAAVRQRAQQLLSPQLGGDLANHVADELSTTLFGSSKADAQSPYSVTNVLKNQLSNLKLNEDKEMATKTTDTFKETIKTSEVPAAFLQKLQEPASIYVYTGIMYGDHGLKKPLDIQI